MLRTSLLALAALGLAGCATGTPAEPGSSNDCFRTSDVSGFEYVDQNHVRVRVGANRTYLLTTNWDATSLNWTFAIRMESTLDRVCVGNGVGTYIYGGDPPQRYTISRVEREMDDTPAGS